MEKDKWFLRPGEQLWRCGNCGKRLLVTKPPRQCPVCGKGGSFIPTLKK